MAVILFNLFSQRANRIAIEMKLLTDEFLELLLDTPSDSQPNRAKKPEGAADKLSVKGGGDGDREAA